jgi:hypothetical protein
MLVRRLLLPLVLAIALLGRAVPASAGPRTDAAFVRATNADRHKAVPPATAAPPLPQGQPVRVGTYIKDDIIWVTVNFEQRICRSEPTDRRPKVDSKPLYPLTGRRWRWHHRRALSWAASSVGRAPGF